MKLWDPTCIAASRSEAARRFGRREFVRLGVLAAACSSAWPKIAAPTPQTELVRRGPARKVLILGAGLSGLVSAYYLIRAGHDVRILEARLRPGGRVHTLREPFSDDLYAEAGAARIPVAHSITLDWVRRFKLELDPFYPNTLADVEYRRGMRILVPERHRTDMAATPLNLTPEERKAGLAGLTQKYLGALMKQAAGVPAAEWPPASLKKHRGMRLDDYLRRQGASKDAVRYIASGLEADSVLDFVRDPSRYAVRRLYKIRGGNDRLPRAFAAKLVERIRYGAEVKRIEQDARRARAVFLRGGTMQTEEADRIICTLPFTVLRGVEIAPPFSAEKQRTVQELTYMSNSRIFLQASKKFWREEGLNGFARTEHPMEIWDPTFDRPGPRGILMAYAYDSLSRKITAMTEAERIRFGLAEMERIFPGIRTHFEGGVSKCWDEDPWARGGAARVYPGHFDVLIGGLAPERRIHFAGEHLSAWSGWMQGALDSGTRVAREVNDAAG